MLFWRKDRSLNGFGPTTGNGSGIFWIFGRSTSPRIPGPNRFVSSLIKLRSKGQSQQRLHEAAQAVSLCFATEAKALPSASKQGANGTKNVPIAPASSAPIADSREEQGNNSGAEARDVASAVTKTKSSRPGRRYDEMRFREKTASREWDAVIEKLEAEIMTRHYSRKTLKTCADWIRKFQGYLKNKPPVDLSSADVKDIPTACRARPLKKQRARWISEALRVFGHRYSSGISLISSSGGGFRSRASFLSR